MSVLMMATGVNTLLLAGLMANMSALSSSFGNRHVSVVLIGSLCLVAGLLVNVLSARRDFVPKGRIGRPERIMLNAIAGLLVGWFGFAAIVYSIQDRLLFSPRPVSSSRLERIAREYPRAEALDIVARDGMVLRGWLVKPLDAATSGAETLGRPGEAAEEISGTGSANDGGASDESEDGGSASSGSADDGSAPNGSEDGSSAFGGSTDGGGASGESTDGGASGGSTGEGVAGGASAGSTGERVPGGTPAGYTGEGVAGGATSSDSAVGTPLVIVFAGQGGEASSYLNLSHRLPEMAWAFVNYRGYGASEGTPSEKALFADSLAVYDYLVSRPDVDGDNVFAMGGSLGTGVATYLASQRPVAGVILFSPYDRIGGGVARDMMPWVPTKLLFRNGFDAASYAPLVQVPALAVIGGEDLVIRPERSRRLLRQWGGGHRLVVVPDGDHFSIYDDDGAWRTIQGFVRGLVK